jgi:hypothetical protein
MFIRDPLYQRQYPFAKPNQILTWGRETTEELLSLFKELYSDPRFDRGIQPGTEAVSARVPLHRSIETNGT